MCDMYVLHMCGVCGMIHVCICGLCVFCMCVWCVLVGAGGLTKGFIGEVV